MEYAAGLTPNLEDFVSGTIFEKLVVEGQNLVWMDASIVYFYDEDGTEFKENRHGVVMGETIDPADVPTPVKEGYTLTGWYEKNAAEPWDFAADTVSTVSYTHLFVKMRQSRCIAAKHLINQKRYAIVLYTKRM